MTNITPGECVTPIPDFHLDRTLYTGRPANPAGRLNKEIHTYDLLTSWELPISVWIMIRPLR